MSYSRREVLRMAGAGSAALWLGGCGSSGNTAKPVAGDEWKQFGGTTLNFISENTAPTSAIAANLEPFKQLTGIDIKITQLELQALVQKVALDFASGQGAYQIVYADPYQILAPYHEALADLNTFQDDQDLPQIDDLKDFIPTQLDATGKFGDDGKLYALPYDAPTMVWMYRKDLFEKHRDRLEQDLGKDPMPGPDSTWDDFLALSKWFKKNASEDVPYGSGHQAKQHDSLMNDFSNVLWAYGGDYFNDGEKVGRFGSAEPGEPLLDRPEAIEAAEMYRKMLEVAHPSSLGWDWTGAAEGFMAGQFAMVVEWHEFASGIEESKIKGKVGYARLPKGPKRTASMFGGTGIGINGVAPSQGAEGGLAVPRVGDLEGHPARQPQERRRRRHADARLRLQAARGREGAQAAVEDAEHPHRGRRVRGMGAGEHRPAPEDRRVERVRHDDLHAALEDAGRPAGPRGLHAQHQGGLRDGDREREALAQEGVMATATVNERRRTATTRAKRKESRFGFESRMMAPALLVLAALSIFPFIYLILMSLSAVGLIGGISLDFVGLDNWSRLFTDEAVGASWVRSIVYFILTVGLEMALGIAIALLVHELVWGKNIALSLILMPMFMAPVIVGLLGRFLTDSTYGLYAWVLRETGLYSGDILGAPTAAFLAVTLMDVWQWTPLIALIVLAGLASVPGQILEAAKVDGATYLQRLRHIVLPTIAGVIIVALLIRSMDAIRYYDIITNTTNGGPADATKIVPIRLYETGFRFFDLGYAAAIGLSMLAVSILLANIFLRTLKRRGLAR